MCFTKKNRGLINTLILSFGMMLMFCAFNTTQSYITTLHPDYGYICLTIVYIVLSVSNFIAPVVISLLGGKLAIIISGIPYIFFILAVGYSGVFLLIFSVIVGFTAAILWASQGTLLVQFSGENMSSYSGLFWGIYQTNSIIGFLIAGLILKVMGISEMMLFIIFSWFFTVGLIVLCFISMKNDNLKEDDDKKKPEKFGWKDFKKQMLSCAKIVVDLKFIMLYPLFLYNGYAFGFYFGTITEKFGLDLIAWTFTCFAIAEFTGAMCFGRFIEAVGHTYSFYIIFFFNIVSIIYTFTLDLNVLFFYLTIFFCGIGDSGTTTLIYSIIGKYFSHDAAAAFSAFKFVFSISTSFQFFTEKTFNFFQIQLIISSLCVLSIIFFFLLELLISRVDKYDSERMIKEGTVDNLNLINIIKRLFKKNTIKNKIDIEKNQKIINNNNQDDNINHKYKNLI